MIPGFLINILMKQIMKFIEKADDKKIASTHEKRISEAFEQIGNLRTILKNASKSSNKALECIEEIEKDIAEIKAVAHKPIDGLTDRLKKLEKTIKIFK